MSLEFHPTALLELDELIEDLDNRSGRKVAERQLARVYDALAVI
jgi:hypothetical protein